MISPSPNRWNHLLHWLASKKEPLIFLALLLLSSAIFWQFGIDRQPIGADRSMQLYVGQQIAQGNPPYLTVIFPKTPLTGIVYAIAMLVARKVEIMDVLAARATLLMFGALGVAFTFLAARYISKDLWVRLAAALTLMGFSIWGVDSATGAGPKIILTTFGLISLWALADSRWLLAGLAASLSFLAWQPAGIFLIVALVTTAWKAGGRSFRRALAGGLIPLTLVGIYLAAENALLPALRQTIWSQFIYLVQGGGKLPRGSWSLEMGRLRLLWIFSTGLGPGEFWFVILGVAGWIGFTLRAILQRQSAVAAQDAYPWPLLLAGYGWLLFSLRELDGYPDLVPLLPYLAFGLGWVLERALSLLRRLVASNPISNLATLAVLLGILGNGLQDLGSINEGPGSFTLQDQLAQARQLDQFLGAEGQIQAIGDPSLLVLSRRTNLTPLIHLGPKHYNLLLQEPGGVDNILKVIEESSPEVILIHPSNWQYPWVQPFLQRAKEQGVLRPAYDPPPVIAREELELGEVPYPQEVNFADQIQLLGYDFPAAAARPGGSMEITLYFTATSQIQENYTIAIQLLGPEYEAHSKLNIFPLGNPYPTSLWAPGEVVLETYELPIPTDFPAPAYGQIKLAFFLYPPWQGGPLLVLGSQGEVLGESAIFGRFRVNNPNPVTVENPVSFTLGDYFRLVGVSISPLAPGQDLKVSLFWQSLKPADRDYQIFLHLLDPQGNILAQGDSSPHNGFYPTTLWLLGEIIEDTHLIPLPSPLTPGKYRLRLGMYLLETGERLPAWGEDGQPLANNEIVIEGLYIE
ncbi:MAG: DolP-mannose mannosyltransferase [Chloroflexi bacterium]|nr:DolP-mannose mannosyltransferase [Chloroflexota bacterium]